MQDIIAATTPTQNERDWTIREIEQQPKVWAETLEALGTQRAKLEAWLAPLLAQDDLRIILSGAGSSAFIGEALAPYLSAQLKRPVEAISTTSIVGDPQGCLIGDRPTLLISYGRSGNSPESIAAVNLADQCVENCSHLIICCNPESILYRACDSASNKMGLAMPAATLDQSFAMTSSVTTMILSTLALFIPGDIATQAPAAIAAAKGLLATPRAFVTGLGHRNFSRMVFLGSGSLQGIATEAALKVLELSGGKTACLYDSPLGFRHGPKFFVDADTLVVLLTSPDTYTRQYDLDLFAELERDGAAATILRLDELLELDLQSAGLRSGWIGPVYLIWCQLLAYYNALSLGISPDNPSPDGTLNRVVQGVTLYPFAESAA